MPQQVLSDPRRRANRLNLQAHAMQNPYTVLGLPDGADEAEIRDRYLALVRQFPPEREPERAAEIRAAYDALREPVLRLESQLFAVQSRETFDSLIEKHRPTVRDQRLPTDLLLSLGE